MSDKEGVDSAPTGVWELDIQTSGGGGGAPGRWAAAGTRKNDRGEVKTVSFADEVNATNWDDMQLRAAIEILSYVANRDPGAECQVFSDGKYLKDAVESHTARVANGGVRLNGTRYRNWNRLQALYELSLKLKVTFVPREDERAPTLEADFEEV